MTRTENHVTLKKFKEEISPLFHNPEQIDQESWLGMYYDYKSCNESPVSWAHGYLSDWRRWKTWQKQTA